MPAGYFRKSGTSKSSSALLGAGRKGAGVVLSDRGAEVGPAAELPAPSPSATVPEVFGPVVAETRWRSPLIAGVGGGATSAVG